MDYKKAEGRLDVRLLRDFNFYTASRIEKLTSDVTEVHIDLTNSKIVDSEAVRLLYELNKAGRKITLTNPPYIFHEVLEVLGLSDFFYGAITIAGSQPDGEGGPP